MGLGVEGMMISPGYSYDKAPDQNSFLKREPDSRNCFQSFSPIESVGGNLINLPCSWNF